MYSRTLPLNCLFSYVLSKWCACSFEMYGTTLRCIVYTVHKYIHASERWLLLLLLVFDSIHLSSTYWSHNQLTQQVTDTISYARDLEVIKSKDFHQDYLKFKINCNHKLWPRRLKYIVQWIHQSKDWSFDKPIHIRGQGIIMKL